MFVLLMYTSSLSTGSRQARDTIPLVPATDLHRGEADYVSLVVVEEDSAEEERRRTRLGALAVMISFEDSCWYRASCIHMVVMAFAWGELGPMGLGKSGCVHGPMNRNKKEALREHDAGMKMLNNC